MRLISSSITRLQLKYTAFMYRNDDMSQYSEIWAVFMPLLRHSAKSDGK